MTVPRRLRPSAAERARTILTQTRGALSVQGAAASARPVTAHRQARQYVPPGGAVTVGDTTGQTGAVAIAATTGSGTAALAVHLGAVAIGYNSEAAANEAVAVGPSSYAPAASAVALGFGATASGDGSIAVGATSQANDSSGTGSVAVGPGTSADGATSVALGNVASATADGAVAVGSGASAAGASAVAIGVGADAPNALDFVLGTSSHNVSVPGDFAVHGATPVGQSATPTTLADVIAVLQAHGLCA